MTFLLSVVEIPLESNQLAYEENNIPEVIQLTNTLLKNIPVHLHEQSEKFYHAIIHLSYYYFLKGKPKYSNK
jgi:hypothetical protein